MEENFKGGGPLLNTSSKKEKRLRGLSFPTRFLGGGGFPEFLGAHLKLKERELISGVINFSRPGVSPKEGGLFGSNHVGRGEKNLGANHRIRY